MEGILTLIKMIKKKRGQIWIETVLYTLIGLVLIALTLSFVLPKINASKDRAVMEQSIGTLNVFNEKIEALLDSGQGNVRNLEFKIKKGSLVINPESEEIYIELKEFGRPYTEPGTLVQLGDIGVLTEEGQKGYDERVTLNYVGIADLKFSGGDAEKRFNSASISYVISFRNLGDSEGDGDDLVEIDIKENS